MRDIELTCVVRLTFECFLSVNEQTTNDARTRTFVSGCDSQQLFSSTPTHAHHPVHHTWAKHHIIFVGLAKRKSIHICPSQRTVITSPNERTTPFRLFYLFLLGRHRLLQLTQLLTLLSGSILLRRSAVRLRSRTPDSSATHKNTTTRHDKHRRN